ncbi:MAG: hypothetical protein PWQ82_429 [Thermosediminibacterales bacterium]|nr:hypothetical protein [Thermosediminibacterales bacterium]MDK2836049.1 hypothetical protein [Thermosediminibacterales bacterium]
MMISDYVYKFFNTLSSKILLIDDGLPKEMEPDFFEAVEQARKEWFTAKSYFDNVTDPDLVDYAIYLNEAARKKYMYLLKKAKENNIKARL